MRIVVTGATGNVGTRVIEALLARGPGEHEIVGLARRKPQWQLPGVRWVCADVSRDPLEPIMRGADAVIHLAWLIQPARDRELTDRVNIDGSRRVFEAVAAAGVPALVHASSVAAYSPPEDPREPVDEEAPLGGIPGAYYSEQKVAVEQILDEIELANAELRVVRARPALIFQRRAATEIRRYFGGPLVPGRLARPSLIPVVPSTPRLVGQLLHAADMGEFYARATETSTARGAYNVAADPPLDPAAIGELLGAKPVRVPAPLLRGVVAATYRARLHPVAPGWLDIAHGVPVMRTDRARKELLWRPEHDGGSVLLELLEGMRDGAGFPTPPLDADAGGPLRYAEFLGRTERV